MGSNKNLFIFLGVAVVALVATMMSGGFNVSEEPDFAQSLNTQRGAPPVVTPPAAEEVPPVSATTPPPKPVATASDETPIVADAQGEAEATPDAGLENPCAEEPLGDDEDASAEGEDLDGTTEVASVPEDGDLDLGLASEDDEAVPSDDDLFLDDEEPEDPIEAFKEMDPRDIIDAKYNDLEERLTTPWNEEDLDNFIPMTGRPDPLTRIREAIPEELMPPRAGETDESEIQLYAASLFASIIVDNVSAGLQCQNVLQIGLDKFASFLYMGSPLGPPMSVGQSQQVPFTAEGVNGNVIIQVTAISTNLVKVHYSAVTDSIDLGISKTQHFIPNKGY